MSEGDDDTQEFRAELAEFGLRASEGLDLDALLAEAARQVARGLGVSHVKVLQLLCEEQSLVVRAGVGWDVGVIGRARVGTDLASPAGYALRTGRPVISRALDSDERFRVPSLLRDHGVKSAVNVILKKHDNVFGVLEADSREARDFGEDDVAFLQTYANILSFAIEQHRLVRHNAELAARQETLLLELQHRIKNNNQKLLGLIRLQLSNVTNHEARDALEQIASRIQALSSVNEHFADQAQQLSRSAQGRCRCSDLRHAPGTGSWNGPAGPMGCLRRPHPRQERPP